MQRLACILLLLSTFSFAAFSDNAFADADKDHHHEDLTATQLGTVHFPVTCAASVRQPFTRGVALLHSFWYEEAQNEFMNITHSDPHCAMAHWGIAMSVWHQLWNEPDAAVIKRGLGEATDAEKLASDPTKPATPREKAYIT